MKAHQEKKPKFIPVALILESQEEVDGVYALFNHAAINQAAGLSLDSYKSLEPFKNTGNTDRLHDALMKLCE